MKKVLLILTCLCSSMYMFSQNTIHEQKVKKDSIKPVSTANQKRFSYLYIGYALALGPSEGQGGAVYGDKSSDFTIGIKYRRKLSSVEAIGFYLAYESDLFRLKQGANKLPLDTLNGLSKNLVNHSKEDLIFYALSLGVFDRINFTKPKAKSAGDYLELGAYGSWNFSINHYTEDELNGNTIKTYTSGLDYPKRIGYGLFAQLGFNNWSIYFKKRVSNLFKDSYNLPELPRYMIGLQLGLFK